MRNPVAVAVLLMTSMLLVPLAAGPSGQARPTPAVSPQTTVAQPQVAKLQDPAITKLQEQVALLIEQDRQKTAQLGQLKYQLGQLQTQLAEFKASVAKDYVPVAGPGGNCSGGFTGIVNISKDPAALVRYWHCKTQ